MENKLLLIMLLSHVIGDYYLQTEKLAKLKSNMLKGLILHGILYSFPFVCIFLFSEKSIKLLIAFIAATSIHFFIDLLKYTIVKIALKKKPRFLQEKEWLIYLMDQGIHMLTIVFLCYFMGDIQIAPIGFLQDFMEFLHLNSINTVQWILLILCIYKPVNITFEKIFSVYKPIQEEHVDEYKSGMLLHSASLEKRKNTQEHTAVIHGNSKKTGAIIGFLERVIITLFINIGQFSAIGLILTAKSIARYEMISKNQQFGEYYLIGTLTSVLSAVLAYYFLIH